MLQELPPRAALPLWYLYRDAVLWASVAREHRPCVFHPGGVEARQALILDSPLDAAAREAADRLAFWLLVRPGSATPNDVSAHCVTLAERAASNGFGRSALLLAKASSAASPDDAAYALIVARVAERFGWRSHAHSWLRRTVAMGRRQGDWASYAEAFVSFGNIAFAEDRLEVAVRNFVRAARAARRRSVRVARAKALHGLFRVASAKGDDSQAADYGRVALRVYPRTHAGGTVLRQESAAVTRMAAVRAAAEKGDMALLADAWFSAVAAIEDLGETPEAAAYLTRLVGAAGGALERRRAQETLRRAEEIARRAKSAGRESGAPRCFG